MYYVLFIDDHSRKAWIYLLKDKSETFDRFKEFKALIENQTGRHIRILRSDNGGEYESNEFDDFLPGSRNQERADSTLPPSTKWGCRKEE